MAKIETHMEDCDKVFGKSYEEVHRWLDEYTKKFPIHVYLEKHRMFRHHAEGVEEAIKKWGFYAGQAAKLHIIRDYEQFLPTPIFLRGVREDEIDKLFEHILQFCHEPISKNKLGYECENCGYRSDDEEKFEWCMECSKTFCFDCITYAKIEDWGMPVCRKCHRI